MWRGPVGLAETNSTLTCRGRSARARPQASGFASTPATSSSRAPSARRMLRKPGGATSTDAIGEPAVPASAPVVASISAASSAAIASAIRRGAIRYGRASFMARLVARSPCSGLAGRSISTGGSSAPSGGAAGRAPDATARAQARSTARRARARFGTIGSGGSTVRTRAPVSAGVAAAIVPAGVLGRLRDRSSRPSQYFGARPQRYRPVSRWAGGRSGWVTYWICAERTSTIDGPLAHTMRMH